METMATIATTTKRAFACPKTAASAASARRESAAAQQQSACGYDTAAAHTEQAGIAHPHGPSYPRDFSTAAIRVPCASRGRGSISTMVSASASSP